MQNNNCYFNLRRLYLIMRADVATIKGPIIITLVTLYSFLFLVNLLNNDNFISVNDSPTIFFLSLFFGGILLSSLGFKNYQFPNRGYFYLLLPASLLEKFLGRLLLTGIVYPVVLLLAYSLFYWFISLMVLISTGKLFFVNTLFSGLVWHAIYTYIIIQAIFILGSSYFKKNALIKTLLSLFCLGIVIVILVSSFANITLHAVDIIHFVDWNKSAIVAVKISATFMHILSLLVAPICWLLTYLRLQKIEVM